MQDPLYSEYTPPSLSSPTQPLYQPAPASGVVQMQSSGQAYTVGPRWAASVSGPVYSGITSTSPIWTTAAAFQTPNMPPGLLFKMQIEPTNTNEATYKGQRIQDFKPAQDAMTQTQPHLNAANRTYGAKVTLEELRPLRADGFWLLYDVTSEHYVELPSKGKVLKANVSFGKDGDIDWVISHRWKDEDGLGVEEGDAPTGFMFGKLPTGKLWVDYLNHLGDPMLAGDVVDKMGALYVNKRVYAKYLWDFERTADVKRNAELFGTSIREMVRGWMWQEIVHTPFPIIPKSAECLALFVRLVFSGAEVMRRFTPNGVSFPRALNAMEVVKLGVDVIWQSRRGLDVSYASAFFVENYEKHKEVITQAIVLVEASTIQLGGKDIQTIVAAACNLDNTNFSFQNDLYPATFNSINARKDDQKMIDGILLGQQLVKTSKRLQLDFEIQQRCLIPHICGFLSETKFEKVIFREQVAEITSSSLQPNTKAEISYCRQIKPGGDDPEVSWKDLDGQEQRIIAASYRFNKGVVGILGVTTESGIRIVFKNGLVEVKAEGSEAIESLVPSSEATSVWATAVWRGAPAQWTEVLKAWSAAENSVQFI